MAPPELVVEAKAPTNLYSGQLVRMAFLSPSVQHAILSGRQPRALSVAALTKSGRMPLAWADQPAWITHLAGLGEAADSSRFPCFFPDSRGKPSRWKAG
jgi:hypothetical protein